MNLSDYTKIFKIETNNVELKKGRILISEPFSVGDIFKRSVVLLTEYSKETGAMGFILNRNIPQRSIDPNFLREFPGINISVSVGGPVGADKLFYIHNFSQDIIEDSIEIMPGLYVGGNYKQLKNKLLSRKIPVQNMRFFAGYSGWQPKQLETEVDRNSWLVKDITPEEVLKIDNNIWTNQLKQLEEKYKLWTIVPKHPHLN